MPTGHYDRKRKGRTASVCPLGSSNLKTNRHTYDSNGLCIRCGRKRRRRSRWYFHRELVGEWMHLECVVQAWGTDLKPRRELVRVKRNGTLEVWKDGEWLDCDYTRFTDHQERRIRKACWGPSTGTPTYRSLGEVPRMTIGDRFWVHGSEEHDGLWECITYRQSQIVCRKILPDYTVRGIPIEEARINKSWPTSDPEADSNSSQTDSPATPRSST